MVGVTYLRDVPLAGMNFVLSGAAARGFTPGDPEWINLGQGQPEIGALPGAPERISSITLDPNDHMYGPVNGLPELRQAIADHYNRTYRSGRSSRYTAANVAVVGGGRPGVNRAIAALGAADIGYLLPDYAAYEDILAGNMPRLRPLAVPGDDVDTLVKAVADAGLSALLMSNPRNPTGRVIRGAELARLVEALSDRGTALLADEFYSHYIYEQDADGRFGPAAGPVSAAAHVRDVDADPVLIVDGLTKNLRYPGWRLGWVLGPADAIAVLERIGQAMDGGPSRPVQRAALAAMEPDYLRRETSAVRAAFAAKRTMAVEGLRAAGIRIDPEPTGTFYVWGSLADMPTPLRTADAFFSAALDHRVITVPGHVFALDPGAMRTDGERFDGWMRFSYGPPADAVATGMTRLRDMVEAHRRG